jgi:hypothetical protein
MGQLHLYLINIVSIIWYIKVEVTSSSKNRSHMDIQVRSNIVLGMCVCVCVCVHVVRINGWLNYETVGLHHKYKGIWYTHRCIQFQM